RIDSGERRPKPDVVLALRNFQLLFRREESTDLLQGFRWNDQVTGLRPSSLYRHVHLGETVSVGCNHSHRVRSQLPKDAVENRPAFFCRSCERSVRDQFLEISRWNAHAL